jgi:hypothetical protein
MLWGGQEAGAGPQQAQQDPAARLWLQVLLCYIDVLRALRLEERAAQRGAPGGSDESWRQGSASLQRLFSGARRRGRTFCPCRASRACCGRLACN